MRSGDGQQRQATKQTTARSTLTRRDVVESIWPNSDFETGVGVNALIGADPGPPNSGAVFHDSAVWVRRVS